ncbi:unnamed product [Ostreococcus tauri]|uniref:Unnamed product n=1 Tax=Ostreococcus tauri TaxID=70448 RepID=A0A096PAF8_OSTTA|nr:unnamed product [Ostreococcus tauri]CEG01904.1 unnamed product [Ostreococcus tauri]|eukprot:XP_022841238.1 unnamed product [Ostreococcus tauri]
MDARGTTPHRRWACFIADTVSYATFVHHTYQIVCENALQIRLDSVCVTTSASWGWTRGDAAKRASFG